MWLVTVGILFSLLTARLNQQTIQRALEPMANLIAFLGCVAHGMEFDEGKHQMHVAALKKRAKKSWPVQASGWIAVIVFFFGMIAAGTGYWSQASATGHPVMQKSK